jgi:hypothetical protein
MLENKKKISEYNSRQQSQRTYINKFLHIIISQATRFPSHATGFSSREITRPAR